LVLKLIMTCRKRDTRDTMKHYSNDEEDTRDEGASVYGVICFTP
jgi:hypothetical protein